MCYQQDSQREVRIVKGIQRKRWMRPKGCAEGCAVGNKRAGGVVFGGNKMLAQIKRCKRSLFPPIDNMNSFGRVRKVTRSLLALVPEPTSLKSEQVALLNTSTRPTRFCTSESSVLTSASASAMPRSAYAENKRAAVLLRAHNYFAIEQHLKAMERQWLTSSGLEATLIEFDIAPCSMKRRLPH